tara:strand:- start:101 stop:544 length:444 start_codon:yes stop_codon:yes gene_type:complete
MINNNSVSLHLFDSGLLTIPFEYCVTRNISNEIFIDDIPETKEDIMVEKMDKIKTAKVDEKPSLGNTYISCSFEDIISTYVFNENKNTFQLINKLEVTDFNVNFNEAFIVATLNESELTINRVTGKATLLVNSLQNGECKLTDKTKF